MNDRELIQRLAKARRGTKGLTQAKVAKQLGVTQQNISHLEADGQEISLSSATAWAEACGLRLVVELVPAGEAQEPVHLPTEDAPTVRAILGDRRLREHLLRFARVLPHVSDAVLLPLLAVVEASKRQAEEARRS